MSVKLEDIVSLCKRRGFIYQGSEIYGGLAGTYDYGPLGNALKRNLRDEWLKFFVDGWDDMYLVDTAVLMNRKVWQASGHEQTFHDPLVECSNCHMRFRADQVKDKCPNCGKENTFGEPRQFNMMLKTNIGPIDDERSITYLRPETAQGMFVNFKNVLYSYQPDMPFGIAQIGKSFRNEISPRDFLFRTREFEIMEFEFFIKSEDSDKYFEKWRGDMQSWFKHLGLPAEKIHEVEMGEEDRAHYSKRTIDFEYDYPFGRAEISGLADRTDFDLKNHQEKSGVNMEYRPKDGGAPFIPHVIEPTWGLDRHVLAVLANAYSEDEQGGEKRVFLKLPAKLAPVKVAVFPLLKNKPELVKKAREVYEMLKKQVEGEVMWDDNGNIGKRYRRQDEIGTPHCITIDFQTLDDDTVTIRNRDTTEQTRQKIAEISLA
ncbi:MAG TPA: glycine--tRNA ligase [Candidatus Saccharimonadales bacterium]